MALPGMIAFGGRSVALTPVVWNSADKTASVTLSNGDKTATASATNQGVRGNIGKSAGKWYCEIVQGATPWQNTGGNYVFGVALAGFATLGSTGVGLAAGSAGVQVNLNNFTLNNGTAVADDPDPGTGTAAGSVFMIALDMDGAQVWFGLDGTWCGVGGVTGVPATGTAPSLSGLTAGAYFPCVSLSDSGGIAHLYASASDCTYSPPSGFSYWSA